ncbi:hypothetical protein BGZ80_008925 [Entomortierella chlamydospora]|uniref:Peptidase C15, pyroglutamyl peptidase I-like protein n=1 Tax=Entomortierella chlamydospora TaxID=101097 RepID=A0A9P6MXX2_9FUNG|nr:hypothetical protein BGZ79_006216 [Entomortierella chlamydospora]KAG0016811.1 hypothetical protein BGZ80_008925 [Entomortierella chlamydospora]
MAPINKRNNNRVKVVLTGFEPFGSHATNPSWLSIQSLNNTYLDLPAAAKVNPKHRDATQAYLVCKELPVEYRKVPELVPSLHVQHSRKPSSKTKPQEQIEQVEAEEEEEQYLSTYYIHLGVGRNGHTAIETQAHRVGYGHPDNSQWSPESKEVPPVTKEAWADDPSLLTTTVDTEALANYLSSEKGWICQKSMDAGLYLCEYTFYLSMAERNRRIVAGEEGETERTCLFVHLPAVGSPYSLEELQRFVKDMIVAVVSFH